MSIFWIISLIIALTVHEYAHAKTADELGDPTPRITGRLTLNPLAHLDPWGTLALLLFHLGWGKPVQVDVYNLRNPRRDMAIISLAGPLANFLTAIFFSLLWRGVNYFFPFNFSFSYFVFSVVTMNLGLGIFNLLPLGPLDGAKVLLGILPYELAEEWERILSQYGLVLLLLLFLPLPGGTSLLEIIFVPLRDFLLRLLLPFPAGMI